MDKKVVRAITPIRVAILVDGAFYRRRAQIMLGEVSPEDRAEELWKYCIKHLFNDNEIFSLYRIFYYDCPPMTKKLYHPFLKTEIDYSKSELYKWMEKFLKELKRRRKFAIRLGKLADDQAHFSIRPNVIKKLCNGSKKFEELVEQDFCLNVTQKGVDMKIGLDIASLAFKKQVDKIVLISGDSDFVPAAKLARREGIDFVLDPLFNPIKPDLFEHIDGLHTCDSRFKPVIREDKGA